MRGIFEVLALPDGLACFLVQRDDCAFWSAGRDDHFVAVQERRFGKTPLGTRAAEILLHVLAPDFFSGIRVEAGDFAPLADGDDNLAVARGRAPRSDKAAPARCAGLAEFRGPKSFSIVAIEADQE